MVSWDDQLETLCIYYELKKQQIKKSILGMKEEERAKKNNKLIWKKIKMN